MKINYDKIADAIYFSIKKGKIDKTVKINRCLLVDINKNGETIGIELLHASSQKEINLESNIMNGIPIEVTSKTPVLV